MKLMKVGTLIAALLTLAWLVYANVPFVSSASRLNEGTILTNTHWMGSGPYARFTPAPDEHTLGCWSTTFAQISYHHRLQPRGLSEYQCSKGYSVDENLGEHVFAWSKFNPRITESTPEDAIDEVARYCYSIATIVQKDFGTGRYLTKLPPIKKLEDQLGIDAKMYFNYKGLFQSKRKLTSIVVRELEADRPLYLYYRDMDVSGSGHSVVLDGYRFDDQALMAHLNFGWGGEKDGWYNLFRPIAIPGDTELRILITVNPQEK